jgi:uncharacterized membrane protein YkvI
MLATLIIDIAILLAKYGIITLVAKGYGTMAQSSSTHTSDVVRILNPEWKKEFWQRA